MSRQLGSRYVLDDVIGKGASGQVWRGHDLDGDMFAFKVLRESIAGDADSVSRFVQERQILLALEHPNLVRVHDMVVEGETLALVMELVNGGDLRAYLTARGTLTPQEACTLTASVADGLAAMHAAGIIHRDIKPENVLIDTSSGTPVPKITDFSIARIVSVAKQTTMMSGTPSYVAPELFDDSPPTVQSDLYSLGIVLYELLAGVPPFRSDSLLSMMKLHSTEPPPRPPGVPDNIWAIVDVLLAKRPQDRPADAASAARSLRAFRLVDMPQQTIQKPAQTVLRPSSATVRRANTPPSVDDPTRVQAGPPTSSQPPRVEDPGSTKPTSFRSPVVLGAVGLLVLLVVPSAIWLVTRSSGGADGASNVPCQIAFARDHQIYVMDRDGSKQTLIDVGKSAEEDPAWSPDGKQIAFTVSYESADGTQGDIWIMNTDGSNPRALSGGAGDDRNPAWSPDGKQIAFTRWFENTAGNDDGDVYVADIDGSATTSIIEGDTEDGRPTWSPDGKKIAFVRWSIDGDGGDDGDILVASADGSDVVPVTTGDPNDNYPDWSPDGSRIAFMRPSSRAEDAQTDVYLTNVDGSGQEALTHTDSSERNPAWSPDGRYIAFARMSGADGSEEGDVYVAQADGGNAVSLTNTDQSDMFPTWSPACSSAGGKGAPATQSTSGDVKSGGISRAAMSDGGGKSMSTSPADVSEGGARMITFDEGVAIRDKDDLRALHGVSNDFRSFLLEEVERLREGDESCRVTLTVIRYRTDEYAEGGVNWDALDSADAGPACGGGYHAFWGSPDGHWRELHGTQSVEPCDDLWDDKVPKEFIGDACIK